MRKVKHEKKKKKKKKRRDTFFVISFIVVITLILLDSLCLSRLSLQLVDASMRKRKVKPLRASRSLSETFPCTGYDIVDVKGTALRGNHVAHIGI